MTPQNQSTRIFTVFWVMLGVAVIAVGLVEIAAGIAEARDRLIRRTQAALVRSVG